MWKIWQFCPEICVSLLGPHRRLHVGAQGAVGRELNSFQRAHDEFEAAKGHRLGFSDGLAALQHAELAKIEDLAMILLQSLLSYLRREANPVHSHHP